MAGEIKTDIVVTAKPQGFAKLRDEAGRLNEEVRKGVSGQTEGLRDAAKSADNFSTSIEKAMKAILGGVKARDELKKMTKQFGDLTKQVDQLKDKLGEAGKARGAFLQGLVQGAVPGMPFLQRGPGMRRQMAGMALGSAARGIAQMPMSGVGGLAQAMGGVGRAALALPMGAGIPIGAPLMAGAAILPMAAGFSGQAIQLQQQQMQLAPFIQGALPTAKQRKRQQQKIVEQRLTPKDIERRAQAAGRRAGIPGPGDIPGAVAPAAKGGMVMLRGVTGEATARAPSQGMLKRQREVERTERNRLIAKRMEIVTPLQAIGQKFGMAEPEMQQLLGAISQAGGGTGRELAPEGMNLPTMVAAQRAYGIGPQTSGAFLQAQRMGGIAGGRMGPEGAAREMTDTIGDALRLGLTGSDMTDYLQQIASGINAWKATGIPVAKDAIAAFGKEVTQRGLAGVRATAIGKGVVGAAQNLAQQGLPQNMAEMLLLQEVGGFKGGDAKQLFQARLKLEQFQGLSKKEMRERLTKLFEKSKLGLKGELGAQTMLSIFQQLGIPMGVQEAGVLAGVLPEEQKLGQRRQRQRERDARIGGIPATPDAVQGRAIALLGEHGDKLGELAKTQDLQIATGRMMIETMTELNRLSALVALQFSKIAGVPLGEFAEGLRKLMEAAAGQSLPLSDVFTTGEG